MSMPDHICQQIHNQEDSNQLIIYVLLAKVKSVSTILIFFSILESLVDDGTSKQIVFSLKQGKHHVRRLYIFNYVYSF